MLHFKDANDLSGLGMTCSVIKIFGDQYVMWEVQLPAFGIPARIQGENFILIKEKIWAKASLKPISYRAMKWYKI